MKRNWEKQQGGKKISFSDQGVKDSIFFFEMESLSFMGIPVPLYRIEKDSTNSITDKIREIAIIIKAINQPVLWEL